MSSIECPYCGKKFPNKMASKEHKKLCNYIPQVDENQVIRIIKNEDNSPDIVKIANPYGKDFPLLQDDDLSHDVTLVSMDGSMVTCHAAVLAASSQFLADLLEEPRRKDNSVLIVSQNIQGTQMKNLIDFLYMGEISTSKEELNNMKNLLDEFQIKAITEDISENIDMFITTEDIKVIITEDILENADIFENDAVEHSVDYADENEKYYGPPKKNPKKLKQIKSKTSRTRNRQKSVCDYCDFKSMFKKKILNHVQKDHPDFFDAFAKIYIQTPCQYCDQKFLDLHYLYLHKREFHSESLPKGKRLQYNINDGLPYKARRQCPHCPIVLKSIDRYQDHIQKHLTGKNLPFECENCDKKFSKSYTFRVHRKKHEIYINPILCNLCGSTFQTKYDYDMHDRAHALEIPQKKKTFQPRPVDLNFCAICSVCGKDFTKKHALAKHIRTAHLEEDKLLKCPHCPKSFSSSESHGHHIKLHFPPTLDCKHCAKKFHTLRYLKRHIKSQHVDDSQKGFICNKCGKGFTDRDNYEGHLNMHAGLKPFKCHYCEMCYQNLSNRMAHEKSRHPDTYIRRTDKFSRFKV